MPTGCPRVRRQDVGVEQSAEFGVGVDRAGERIHEREDAGRIVVVAVVLGEVGGGESVDAGLEVGEGVVEVDVQDLFTGAVCPRRTTIRCRSRDAEPGTPLVGGILTDRANI